MKFLHICMPSKRMMNTFIKMVRENDPVDDHRFLFWDKCYKDDRVLFDYGNVAEITGANRFQIFKQMKKEMRQADIIVYHGLICSGAQTLFLFLHPEFLKKMLWIVHGIDLINYIREDKSLKSVVINWLGDAIRKKIPHIVFLTPEDKEIYIEKFGEKGKHFYVVPKPLGKDTFDRLLALRNPEQRKNKKKYVQVAHNAYTFNNHFDLLNKLQKYKDEDALRIMLPLSYGNDWVNSKENYKEDVVKYARDIFGEKVIAISKLMPIEEYDEFLWNMDIGVFGALRQNALGNIIRLLLFGNKVFLPRKSPLFKFFTENNVKVFSTESIEEMDYDTFCRPQPCSDSVALFICKLYHPDCSIHRWNYVFGDVAYHLNLIENAPQQVDESEIVNIAKRILEAHILERKAKSNYVCVKRYQTQRKGTIMNDCRDIVIMGTGGLAADLKHALDVDNQKKMRWFLYGFCGYKETLGTVNFNEDVIGDPDTARIQNRMYLSAVENPYERELFALKLLDRGAIFRNYAYRGAICTVKTVGRGCVFGATADINYGVEIGAHTYILGGKIERGVSIGNYVTIERGCVIEKYVVIGDYVTIGKRVRIAEGVHIGKGAVIADDTRVVRDVPGNSNRDMRFLESDQLIEE